MQTGYGRCWLYATGRCAADNESMYTGFNNDPYRSTWCNLGDPRRNYAPRQDQSGVHSQYWFGSAHWSGCHFVFCDGRVKMINYTIDATTYGRLGNRRDGQIINAGDY